MRPSRMTMTRSDMPMISGISEDTMMTARPSRGKLAHEFVDGGLRADVDALGRLVEDDDLRLGRQPLGDHDLLLVAAGERADAPGSRLAARRSSRSAYSRASVEFPGETQEAVARRCAPETGSVTFWKIGERQHGALAPALLRARRRCRRRSASAGERTTIGLPSSVTVPPRRAGDAEQGLHDLAAAGADQAVEAEDLALAQVEGDVGELGRVATGPRPQARARRSARRAFGKIWSTVRPTISATSLAGVASATSPSPTDLAVAEDGVAVGDAEDLVELVADEEDRLPLAPSACATMR